MAAKETARLEFTVKDEKGEAVPFRAEWGRSDEAPGGRVWSDTGAATVEVPADCTWVLVRRGIHYDAVKLDIDLRAGDSRSLDLTLRKRFDPRALGWYGGENHMHVLHGRNDPPASIAEGGRKAAADGLDYIQLAAAWDPSFEWLSTEELNRQCREASTEAVTVGWNIEAPKAYMSKDDGGKSGNLHCYGHGWTVGLKDNALGKDFFSTGPNFHVIQEVHRQGGIVGCAHPVRAGFRWGNFVSNWASELPFDFVAGTAYDAVDILNDSPLLFFESEHIWYNLLNLGYRVAGTGNSDGSVGGSPAMGRYRTYTRIDGGFTWEKLAKSMRAGRNIATSGPFVLFEVDEEDPGAEFPADNRVRRARIRAWSGPLPGETLTSVQLVRNGVVIRAWNLRTENAREWETVFEISDDEFAWYCVRVLSNSCDPRSVYHWGQHLQELAVANPVYFLPEGFQRPTPALARVALQVTGDSNEPLAASVTVWNDDCEVDNYEIAACGGTLTVPATASLCIKAPGYGQEKRNLYMDCSELYEYCRNIGTVWPSFFSPETYHELRARLANLKLTVVLKKRS